LRILGLGKTPTDQVDADVFLLTERRPTMLPAPSREDSDTVAAGPGLLLTYDQRADGQLLRDLHDDKSGSWVPLKDMWLSRIAVQETAGALKYDLAIDQSGSGTPSVEAAGYTVNGLQPPLQALPPSADHTALMLVAGLCLAGLVVVGGVATGAARQGGAA
jgi:hypothetical protein